MALFLFTKQNILEGVDSPTMAITHAISPLWSDIVEASGERQVAAEPRMDGNNPDPGPSCVPFRIFNIGNNQPVHPALTSRGYRGALGRRGMERELLPFAASARCARHLLMFEISSPNSATGHPPLVTEGVRRRLVFGILRSASELTNSSDL